MRVHQIKVDFNVTEQIKRYVYVYLIEGKHCYLVDSGVAYCEQIIIDKIHEIGREITDIKGVFLTHAHPDHIGTAYWFHEHTGCKIYAGNGEKNWIEDIDLQYKERPIPNFYKIAGKSVKVDVPVKDGDIITLDETFSVTVVGTAGHSIDEVSYKMGEVLFIGDSVPVAGDIPIYVDAYASICSLEKIKSMKSCKVFYPAWDVTYDYIEVNEKVDAAIAMIKGIDLAVKEAERTSDNIKEIMHKVCEILHKPMLMENPLFARTVASHLVLGSRLD